MLNYACEAGEAGKAGNSYTATLWQRRQLLRVSNCFSSKVLLQTDVRQQQLL